MGKLSSIFANVKNGFTGKGRTAYFNRTRNKNRESMKKGGYNAGYGAVTFRNIIDAHSDADEIVQEFGLDQEDAAYGNCYQRAYGFKRKLYRAIMPKESMMLSTIGIT